MSDILSSVYSYMNIVNRIKSLILVDKSGARLNKSHFSGNRRDILGLGIILSIGTIIGIERGVKRGVAGKRSAALGEDKVADREDDGGIRCTGLRDRYGLGIAAVDDIAGADTGNADIGAGSRCSVCSCRNARDSVLIERILCKVAVLVSVSSVYTLRSVEDRDGISIGCSGRAAEFHLAKLRLISQLHDLSHDVDDRRNKLVPVGVQGSEKVLDYRAELRVRNDLIERAVSLGYRSRKNCVEDIGDESHDALLESLRGEDAGLILNKQVRDAGQILINEQSVEDRINNILEDSLAAAVGKLCGKNRFV